MVIVGTSRLTHPTVSCRRADRPAADPTGKCWWFARSGPLRGRLRGGAEDVVPERTGLHWSAPASGEAQRAGEGPASLRCVQALRGGVQRGPPTGEPSSRIGDQGPRADDHTQQFVGRSAFPAPHTG